MSEADAAETTARPVPTAAPRRRRVLIMGAGGRDFHDFNVVFRDDPTTEVVAFTAAQIPGIDDRRYPASLAGPSYPDGIPIRPEAEMPTILDAEQVDEVVFAYSDLSHGEVMRRASIAMAHGADFRLIGSRATMLRSSRPVIAVVATRTGCGKSQTSRRVCQLLGDAGLRAVLVRHPMPYGELEAMRVQRFASMAEIDAASPTIEEREEYETPVAAGITVFAGVDYEAVLRQAEAEADVIVWDGGNNDLPFFRPDLTITVVDALRPGQEVGYHPGEVNLRIADAVVINKIDAADSPDVLAVVANVRRVNPDATLVLARSPIVLADGPALAGRRVLVVEDGPTITHGGMPYGAGLVAARAAGATDVVDPRPFGVGSLADTFATHPHIGSVLPAMGYGDAQLRELAATIRAADCDVVVAATPMDLERLIEVGCPVRRATYELEEIGRPGLGDVLAPQLSTWCASRTGRGARLRPHP